MHHDTNLIFLFDPCWLVCLLQVLHINRICVIPINNAGKYIRFQLYYDISYSAWPIIAAGMDHKNVPLTISSTTSHARFIRSIYTSLRNFLVTSIRNHTIYSFLITLSPLPGIVNQESRFIRSIHCYHVSFLTRQPWFRDDMRLLMCRRVFVV